MKRLVVALAVTLLQGCVVMRSGGTLSFHPYFCPNYTVFDRFRPQETPPQKQEQEIQP